MLDAIRFIFDWGELRTIGFDCVVYSVLALVGSLLFIFRMALDVFLGIGDTGDLDMDTDLDGSAEFSLFSFLSITAFLMGTGWMGLAARLDLQVGAGLAAGMALAFGLVLMFGSAGAVYGIRQLAEEKTYDHRTAVGRTGTVYLTIPGESSGNGKVEVSISGRRMIVSARTTGPTLPAFVDVRVLDVRDDGVLLVEKAD